MKWRILNEQPNPGFLEGESPEAERTSFLATGEEFVCDEAGQVEPYLRILKMETGVCHGAELTEA